MTPSVIFTYILEFKIWKIKLSMRWFTSLSNSQIGMYSFSFYLLYSDILYLFLLLPIKKPSDSTINHSYKRWNPFKNMDKITKVMDVLKNKIKKANNFYV